MATDIEVLREEQRKAQLRNKISAKAGEILALQRKKKQKENVPDAVIQALNHYGIHDSRRSTLLSEITTSWGHEGGMENAARQQQQELPFS